MPEACKLIPIQPFLTPTFSDPISRATSKRGRTFRLEFHYYSRSMEPKIYFCLSVAASSSGGFLSRWKLKEYFVQQGELTPIAEVQNSTPLSSDRFFICNFHHCDAGWPCDNKFVPLSFPRLFLLPCFISVKWLPGQQIRSFQYSTGVQLP